MRGGSRRDRVRRLLGRTVAAVVVADGPRSPAAMVVLCFSDGSTCELYSAAPIAFAKDPPGPTTPAALRDAMARAWPGYDVELVEGGP